ncbi:c-type cytochrome biogenesis protein CcmI [Avibacterium paragallinarum]|uniref:c-type cytochrome biogenesis protein CcmI n=1 Tax=Avibacterium paragallinarum TaxID=728 RepID=UPI0039865192
MTFWLSIGLLLLLTFGLWLPLGRGLDWQTNHRQRENIARYREQTQGNVDAELAQELAQRLLDDEKQLEKQPHFIPKTSPRYGAYLVVLMAVLVVVPLGYYFSLDRFSEVQQALRNPAEKTATPQNAGQSEDRYVLKIQQRLRQNPNNAEDWIALGQAYMTQNEVDNALLAYSYAERLTGAKPYLLGLIANGLYQQAGQKITPQVRALLDQALAQDPKEVSSLSLLAGEAFVQGRYADALHLWQQVLDAEKSSVDRRAIIQNMQMAEMLQNAKTQKAN